MREVTGTDGCQYRVREAVRHTDGTCWVVQVQLKPGARFVTHMKFFDGPNLDAEAAAYAELARIGDLRNTT